MYLEMLLFHCQELQLIIKINYLSTIESGDDVEFIVFTLVCIHIYIKKNIHSPLENY